VVAFNGLRRFADRRIAADLRRDSGLLALKTAEQRLEKVPG
jgi:hypothetical protein